MLKNVYVAGGVRTPFAVPPEVVKQARRLNRKNPRTGQRRSLRTIAKELGKLGYLGPSGKKDYHAGSIKAMLERK